MESPSTSSVDSDRAGSWSADVAEAACPGRPDAGDSRADSRLLRAAPPDAAERRGGGRGRRRRPGSPALARPGGCAPGWPASARSAARQPGPRAAVPHRPARPTPRPTCAMSSGPTTSPSATTADQLRKSGDPYITHPLAVAQILAELGMTPPTLCAALLHDTVEDTAYTLDAAARGLRRRGRRPRRRRHQARQGQVRRGGPGRDRPQDGRGDGPRHPGAGHQARRPAAQHAHDALPASRTKQEQKARETLEIYAPLAHRLGMNTIKWELEDLAFATLYPKMYDEIVRLVAERAPSRDEYLAGVIDQRRGDLRERQDPGDGHRAAEALLLRLPEDDRARPRLRRHLRPGRHPRPGRLGPRLLRGPRRGARAVEPGARAGSRTTSRCPSSTCTSRCTRRSSGPRASRSSCRSAPSTCTAGPSTASRRTGSTRRTRGSGQDGRDKADRQSDQRHGLAAPAARLAAGDRGPGRVPRRAALRPRSPQVFVFTPKGDVIALPPGATPVDFAYAVHTEVGHRCVGARVNGRLVPLESTLDNGDVVEVFTSKAQGAGPEPRLADVRQERRGPATRSAPGSPRSAARRRSSRARTRSPRRCASRACRSSGCCPPSRCTTLAHELRYPDITALYAAIGEGHVSAQSVVQRLVESLGGEEGAIEDLAEVTHARRSAQAPAAAQSDPGVVVKGADGRLGQARPCCTPVPGDRSSASSPAGSGVSVHRADCVNVAVAAPRSRTAWSRSSGRRRRPRCSWSRSRSRRSTGPGCCPTSPGCCPTSTSTSCRRRSRRPATGSRCPASPSRWATRSTSATCSRAVRGVDGVFDVYRVTSGKS